MMEWQVIVALIFGIPLLLIPVVLIWYLNIGGLVVTIQMKRERKAAVKTHNNPQVHETPPAEDLADESEREYEETLIQNIEKYLKAHPPTLDERGF